MSPTALLDMIKDSLAPHLAEAVTALLFPVLVFADTPSNTDSLTHFGGTPHMSQALDWPKAGPATLPDGAETLHSDIAGPIAKNLPLSFVAQIDLATLPADAPASGLPRQGRLLFFYDPVSGPFENGPRFARVLWDSSPADQASPRDTPASLMAAEQDYIAETKEALANFQMPEFDEDLRKAMRAAGMSEAEIEQIANAPAPDLSQEPVIAPFRAPRAPKALLVGQMLPSAQLSDFAGRAPDLHALYFSESDAAYAFQEAYDTLTYESSYSHMLGTPLPEQDDPRLDAATLHLLGKQFAGEDWTTHKDSLFAEAQNWELLLEITFADWLQSGNFEGTIYFLIRKEDLADRRFERAIAVFQQT